MHIKVGNKNIYNNDLFVTSLRVKGQLVNLEIPRDDRPLCELVPNNLCGVAVTRLKVKRQSNKMIKNLIKR